MSPGEKDHTRSSGHHQQPSKWKGVPPGTRACTTSDFFKSTLLSMKLKKSQLVVDDVITHTDGKRSTA